MSTSYVMEKYQPPKNQAPSKVRRFPLYRRPGSKPAPAAPPAPEAPKEEKPAPPPAAPVWSNWQFIKEPLWEGYWRASAQEDGGWHYQLTKDGKTIWEQKVPQPEPPKPSTTTAKTEGEQVLSGEIPAPTASTNNFILHRAQALSRRTRTMTAADDDMHNPSFNDTIHYSSLPPKLRALILRGHSSSSSSSSNIDKTSTTIRSQKASSTSYHHQRSKEHRQDRSVGSGNSIKDRKVLNHRDNDRDRSVLHSEEARTSQAASAAQESHWDDYASHKKRKGRHGPLTGSWETGSYQNSIGEIVSAEKDRKFNAKRIVDSWQWG